MIIIDLTILTVRNRRPSVIVTLLCVIANKNKYNYVLGSNILVKVIIYIIYINTLSIVHFTNLAMLRYLTFLRKFTFI